MCSLSQKNCEAGVATDRVSAALTSAGLPMHPVTLAAGGARPEVGHRWRFLPQRSFAFSDADKKQGPFIHRDALCFRDHALVPSCGQRCGSVVLSEPREI